MYGDDDRGNCVNRMEGDVRVKHCDACGCGTWHQNGVCCKCRDGVSSSKKVNDG